MRGYVETGEILTRVRDLMGGHCGQAFFDRAAILLAELLNVRCVLIGRWEEGDGLQVVSWYRGGRIERHGHISTRGTPLEHALQQERPYVCAQNAWRLFPQDEEIQFWKAEFYWGGRLEDRQHTRVLGAIALYDPEPRQLGETERLILELLSGCIGKELEWCAREEALDELRTKFRHAQRLESLGVLQSGIAHDFNNLLTGILGFTELALAEIESAPGDSHEVAAHLRQVLTLSRQARDLVRQLMLLGHSEEGSQRSCPLHSLLRDFVTLIRRMLPENICVELDLAPGEIVLEAHPAHVQQVLLNLVLNARDAMPQGGRLRIRTERPQPESFYTPHCTRVRKGPCARLSISDTGTGIAPEILPRIFEPFFTTKETGTGLGLSIVREIIHSYGGAVEVESRPQGGTSFHIFWPMVEEPTTTPAIAREEALPRGDEMLLLVEDDPLILALGRRLLEKLGYRVLTAQHGQEAIEQYKRHGQEIRLVLLDLVTPGMSGKHVLAELRRLDPNVRVLVVTGHHSKEYLTDFPWETIHGLLLKPYNASSLAHAVRQCLDGRRSEMARPQ